VNYQVHDAAVVVIPTWLPLTFSIFVFALTLVSLIQSSRIKARSVCIAEQMATACEAYARTNEALAPVQEALGQPAEAEAARARAAEYRERARRLREQQQVRKGRFRASGRAAEPSAGPGEGDGRGEAPEGPEGALRAVSGSEG